MRRSSRQFPSVARELSPVLRARRRSSRVEGLRRARCCISAAAPATRFCNFIFGEHCRTLANTASACSLLHFLITFLSILIFHCCTRVIFELLLRVAAPSTLRQPLYFPHPLNPVYFLATLTLFATLAEAHWHFAFANVYFRCRSRIKVGATFQNSIYTVTCLGMHLERRKTPEKVHFLFSQSLGTQSSLAWLSHAARLSFLAHTISSLHIYFRFIINQEFLAAVRLLKGLCTRVLARRSHTGRALD